MIGQRFITSSYGDKPVEVLVALFAVGFLQVVPTFCTLVTAVEARTDLPQPAEVSDAFFSVTDRRS